MKLSIIIINWNAAEDSLSCIKNIKKWVELQPTIWVVDNASTDGSVDIISKTFPSVNLIQSRTNLGFAGGNNLAFHQILAEHTQHEENSYIFLLNNDAFISEENLLYLVDTLQNNPHIGIVGPLFTAKNSPEHILSAGGRQIEKYINTHLKPEQLKPDILKSGQPYKVAYTPGTAVLIRSKFLKETGLFDETYFFSGEMADLCERMRLKGYDSSISPLAKAYHNTERSEDLRNSLYAYYILRNRFLFIRKFRKQKQLQLFIFWTVYGLAFMTKAMLRGEWGSIKATWLAIKDGLSGIYGGQNERVWGNK